MLIEHSESSDTNDSTQNSNQTPNAPQSQSQNRTESEGEFPHPDVPQPHTDILPQNNTKSQNATQPPNVPECNNDSQNVTQDQNVIENETQSGNSSDSEQKWFSVMLDCMASKGKLSHFNLIRSRFCFNFS